MSLVSIGTLMADVFSIPSGHVCETARVALSGSPLWDMPFGLVQNDESILNSL